jgi:D-glutamate cyclase
MNAAGQAFVDQRIDTLINVDFGERANELLYEAARADAGRPLVRAAAERLAEVPAGRFFVITTGSLSRSWISPNISENDGPAGAAALARALSIARQAIPVVVAEASLLTPIGKVFEAAGFSLVSLEQAQQIVGGKPWLAAAVLESFAIVDEEATSDSKKLFDKFDPTLLVATERAGRNSKGIYHNARGQNYGEGRARVDYLFEEAERRNVATIGVGDGGNEIGMGRIAPVVEAHVPFGKQCACGCGGGIAAITKTSALVTAACSNWGCYGIVASLAVLDGDERLLHTPAREEALLEAGARAGLIDSSSGTVGLAVDGIPLAAHLAIIELLHELGVREIERTRG